MITGQSLQASQPRRIILPSLISVVLVNLVGTGIVYANAKAGRPIVTGWLYVLCYYAVTLSLFVGAVRAVRRLSPVFRITRFITQCVVLVAGFVAYGVAFIDLWHGVFRNVSAVNSLNFVNNLMFIIYAGTFGNHYQGIGIIYLGLFWLVCRLTKSWERKAVAAAPISTGDTRLRSAREEEIRKAGLFREDGSYVAVFKGREIHVPLEERTIVAPQGSGKTVAIVVPALLRETHPVVVTDTKGELLAITCERRAQFDAATDHRIIYIADPYKLSEQPGYRSARLAAAGRIVPVTLNPFDLVDVRDSEAVDRMMDVAMDCVLPRPKQDDSVTSHFYELSRVLVRGIAWAGLCGTDEGLTRDGTIVRVSPGWVLDRLVEFSGRWSELIAWLRYFGRYSATAASTLSAIAPEERGSVYSTATKALAWLDDHHMRSATEFTTVNFDLLADGVADLFLLCPGDQTRAKAPWISVWLKVLFTRLQYQPIEKRPRKDILCLLEELGQFGRLAPVEEAYTIIRSKGLRIWAVFQTVGQTEPYANPKLFFTAAAIQTAGTMDEDTIDMICKISGSRREIQVNVSEGAQGGLHPIQSRGGGSSLNDGRSLQEVEANVLTPDVVRGLGRHQSLVFVTGLAQPIIHNILPYYEDRERFPGARPNPEIVAAQTRAMG